jgi:hypothetical protein
MSNVRGSHWSVTINNPTEKDEEEIALARQKRWSVEGQKEIGESGTPHYQLYVRTPQVRFAAVKKAFSRAHIELAKTPAALANYVHKEETRVGQLSESQDQYPSLSKLWDLIYSFITTNLHISVYVDPGYGPTIERWNDERSEMVSWQPEDPLSTFDIAIKSLILRGYHVESMAVNPQVRASWKNYWFEILHRTLKARTTATPSETIVSQSVNEDELAVELNVPTIHNNATLEEKVSS